MKYYFLLCRLSLSFFCVPLLGCLTKNQLNKIDDNTYSFASSFLWAKAENWQQVRALKEIIKVQYIETFNLDENRFTAFWKNLKSSFDTVIVVCAYDLKNPGSEKEERIPQGFFTMKKNGTGMMLYSTPLGLVPFNQLFCILKYAMTQWAPDTESVYYALDEKTPEKWREILLQNKWKEWETQPSLDSQEKDSFLHNTITFKYQKDIQKKLNPLV